MKLPRKYWSELHFNDETYLIKFVKRIPGEKASTVGLCDPEKKLIYIKKGMSLSQTFRTFFHEALHALCDEYKIKIRHKDIYKLEKAICDTLMMNF
jgi:Zn-dependent peptidase ImmA (M78 family)